MAGPPVLNGPFTMPMMNGFVPRWLQPWIYVVFAVLFQLSGCIYGGVVQHAMGDTCLMREDVMMIVLCGVVGVNMPFPFLFRFKFRFTNRQLLMNAALVIAACNFLAMHTESVPVLCILSYLAGFFKLCGTFECMSNIQLWMTPKRDFSVFFPLLYCIVLGSQSLSPWISLQLAYIFQDWQAMNAVMMGLLVTVALVVYVITHPFRIMKPYPLISVDWLGCALWSALMIEVIFLFNYGEYYNWWDGQMFRTVTFLLLPTIYFTIQRMRHIRHPYIEPAAWHYKRLMPLLALFVLLEMVNATPKVLQNTLTGAVLHFGIMDTSTFYLLEFSGVISGCLFTLIWMKVLNKKFTHLLTIGSAAMLAYLVFLYFMVSPGLNIELFYFPAWCRQFGIAIFFTALTIYLEEIMPFQHFFMGLTMVGLLRNGVAETVFSGIYNFFLRHNIVENLSRGMEYDRWQATMISVKQLFGIACFMELLVLMAFLLWDIQPVRDRLKKMPLWGAVGRVMRMDLRKRRRSAD